MQKERNKYYPLADMAPGDRFYFLNDRKKIIYQLIDEKPFEIKVQAGYRVHYANCRADNPKPGDLQLSQHKLTVNHNPQLVVYLRNINDKANTEQWI